MDSDLYNAWEAVLNDIEDNSPYHAKFVAEGVGLYLDDSEDVPGGIVGIIHSTAEWKRIKRDVQRFGVWPAGISF